LKNLMAGGPMHARCTPGASTSARVGRSSLRLTLSAVVQPGAQ
jgi:hypothetical protein